MAPQMLDPIDNPTSWGIRETTKVRSRGVNVHEWPKVLQSDLAWEFTNFESEKDYTLILTENDIQEIKYAIQHFNSVSHHKLF
jgi:hypothetical protein